MSSVFFYMFATILVLSAGCVVFSRHPMHAVLGLIVCFFNAAGIFLLLEAEFMALVLILVYIGAVAVLFLFVIMMLDIRHAYHPLYKRISLPTAILALQLGIVAYHAPAEKRYAFPAEISNTHAIGAVLYTDYFFAFQSAGIILLIAMIGAIFLTLRKPTRKQQNNQEQLQRTKNSALLLKKIPLGKGWIK